MFTCKSLNKSLSVFFALFFFASSASALVPDRRKAQFDSDPGYLLFPSPYELPGLGSGLMAVGYMGNIAGTNADSFVIAMNGDAAGFIGSVDELFLIPEYLYFNRFQMLITQYGINSYSKRGMDSEKDDYNIMVGDRFAQGINRLVLTLFDRRLEMAVAQQKGDGRSSKILTAKGDLVVEYDDPITFEQESRYSELFIDLTDDYGDPRSGFRASYYQFAPKAQSLDTPEYTVLDQSYTYYIPMGVNSTMVFNYFLSDATVSREGETDLDVLKAKNGLASCALSPDPTACELAVTEAASNTYNGNKYGTATALGGSNRMRAYPNGRYQAAHAKMMGAEFRWNILAKHVSFDWYFLSDVQEALQVAFFYEQGTVAETKDALGEITRASYGSGVRLVAGSGAVYRMDVASGEEGTAVTMIFEYPWEPGGM